MPKKQTKRQTLPKAAALQQPLRGLDPFVPAMSLRRRILTVVLALAGIVLWLAYDKRRYTPVQLEGLALFLALACVPAINAKAGIWFEALRHPSPRRRAIIAIGIAVVSAAYLLLLTFLERQEHFPHFHDESMHLIQAQLLARGKLWAQPHPLPQFFETFFVFVKPVYAPMQFPGASILYVPGIWMGWPYWFTSVLIAAATIGLMYRVVAEAIDGLAGILAALWLICTADLRFYELMVLSYPAALLLGLAMVWAWLRWRERKTAARCALVGALAGWAAITRPADALCFALPVGLAMLFDLAGDARRATSEPRPNPFWPKAGLMAAMLILGALPFLAMQLIFDRGVTGSWLVTPHSRYVELFHPSLVYGLSASGVQARPQTTLAQKLDYYDSFVIAHTSDYTTGGAVKEWITLRLPTLLRVSTPRLLALLLLPLGLLGLTTRPRWVLFAVLPLFFAFYSLSAIFAGQYSVILFAPMVPLALLGGYTIVEATGPARRFAMPIVVVFLAGVAVMGLPSLRDPVTEQQEMPVLTAAEEQMAQIPQRAVVFCRYKHGDNLHEEPVFNTTTADIDAARVVRAHDLGPMENIKLYEYYQKRQPGRAFYRFDRSTKQLTPMDPVAEFEAARRAAS